MMRQEKLEDFRTIMNNVYPINDAEWEFVVENITLRKVNQNEMVINSGEKILNFNFLISGALRLFFVNNGKEFTQQIFTTKRFVADLIGIKSQQPTSFYLEALVDSWIIEIPTNFLNKLLSISPTYEKVARNLYENAALEQMYRIKELIMLSPFEHYSQFMTEHKDIASKMTQAKIARCLNMAPETLSRFKQQSL